MPPAPDVVGQAVIAKIMKTGRTDASLKSLTTAHASLRKCVDSALPGRQVYAFGSITAYGFMEAGSDVDFVILDPKQVANGKGLDEATQQAKALQAHALGQVAKSIRAAHRGIKIEEVKRTRVPVLRASVSQPPAFPLPFDVTADRRNGVRNSWLLRSYFSQYPQSRWLAMAVKRWSKETMMNHAAQGFLTSYGFNILVVHYYQHALRKMDFVPLSTADVARVAQLPTGLPLEAPTDMKAFGEEVLGFFDYYLSEFKYDEQVVSLSRPEVTTPAKLGWTREREDALKMQVSDGEGGGGRIAYRLCIEDPFEVNLNVGRNVSAFKLDIFKQHFARARETGLGWIP
jgi:DNA polymerase sigma